MVRRREAALCLAICFPQHVCSLPHEIQNAFNKMSKYACPGAAPLLVGIAANNGQVRDYARWVQQLPGSPTICEIGFNCGHSTATFLEANPRSRVINFDMTDLKNFPWPAYSTDPIDVVFSPNVNNATAIEVDRRNREAAKRLWETPLPADSRAAQSTPPDCATLRMRNG